MPDQPTIVIDNLRVVLAGSLVEVVQDVTFSVNAREVLGLVGESGSGKTTVALALLGHTRRGLAIAGGKVVLEGRSVLAMSPSELRRMRGRHVAYVPQDPSSALNPALKVGLQLREVLSSHARHDPDVPEPSGRMAEVLAEVRLPATPEILSAYPHQLSVGQQQRIALAMAFACRPQLIVLDEPTTGLDVTTQRHVLDAVRGLCNSYRVAAVYVTHDLAVIAELADRVAVMYAGRLVELGPTGPVFLAPAHPYTRGLLRAIPSPDQAHTLVGISGQPPRPGYRPLGCSFEPRCSLAIPDCSAAVPPLVAIADQSRMARCIRAEEVVRISAGVRQMESALMGIEESVDEEPAIQVVSLVARYGGKEVLHDVELMVPRQRCVALVGESGSGKTTLARCITALHPNWSGTIIFEGRSLGPRAKDRPREVLRAIQYVFQNPYTSLNPRKTVGQIVEQPFAHFFRMSRREREDRVVAALEAVALSGDFLGRYPDQLSGGERQRVAIARALIVEPELIVCDEVTSALDVSVQAVIVELLRQLQRERDLSLLFITHNLALARSIAQEVVVMNEGRVVETGPTARVLDRPEAEYTARLLQDVPKLSLVRPTRTANPTVVSS